MCRAGRTAAAGRSRRCAAPRPPVEVADDGAMERLQVPEVVAAGDALAGQPGQSIVADLGLHRGQIGHAGGLDSPPTPGAPAAPTSTSPPNPAPTSCRPPTRPTHTPASSRSKTGTIRPTSSTSTRTSAPPTVGDLVEVLAAVQAPFRRGRRVDLLGELQLAGAGGDGLPTGMKAAEAAQRIQELSSQRTGQAE